MHRTHPIDHEEFDRVIAVLLADGWHRVDPGSFDLRLPHGDGWPAWFAAMEIRETWPETSCYLAAPMSSVVAVRFAQLEDGDQ